MLSNFYLISLSLAFLHCGSAPKGQYGAALLIADPQRDESYVSSANTTGQSPGEIAYTDSSRGVIQVFGTSPFEHRREIALGDKLQHASIKSLAGGKVLVAYNTRNIGIQKGDHFELVRDIGLVGDFSRVVTNGRQYLALADVTGGLFLAEVSEDGTVLSSWTGGSSIDAEKPFEIRQGAFVGETRLVFAADQRLLVLNVPETLVRNEMSYKEIQTKAFTATKWLAAASGESTCINVVLVGDGELRTINVDNGTMTATSPIDEYNLFSRGEFPTTHAVLRPKVKSDSNQGRSRVRILQVNGAGGLRERDIFVAASSGLGTIRETYLDGDMLTALGRTARADPIEVRRIRLKDSLVTALRDIPAYSMADRIFFAGNGVMAVTKSALGKVWFDRLERDGAPEEVTGFNRTAVVH